MLIYTKINLPLEERFNLLIKNRISNSYINVEGSLINVFSPSDLINKELLNKGIDCRGKNIDDLVMEIERLSIQRSREDFENLNIEDWKKADREVWVEKPVKLTILFQCKLTTSFGAN